jgi:hypothetical protein
MVFGLNGEVDESSAPKQERSIISGIDEFSPKGLICPRCEKGAMSMDGQMNLICPYCDYVLVGGYT